MPAGTKPQGDGRAIIFSAPSGAGKTTVVRHLMSNPDLALGFSVSATTRAPRAAETDGHDYHFLTVEEFASRLADQAFVEHEEVYEGLSYGTLCSEVERLWAEGRTPLFDVDVVGGQTLKSVFGDSALVHLRHAALHRGPRVAVARTRHRRRSKRAEAAGQGRPRTGSRPGL